jgi:hypothetical protein
MTAGAYILLSHHPDTGTGFRSQNRTIQGASRNPLLVDVCNA